MYFENIIFNLILIVVIITICALLNWFLNHQARFLMKYTSSLKMNSKEIAEKYSNDENVKIQCYPSNGNNDLDNYIAVDNCIFINARHFYSTSLYTLGRTLYFLSMSKVLKNNPKAFKLQHTIDNIFILLEVLSWGLLFIGLLLKVNVLIIVALSILLISWIFIFINSKTIKQYYKLAVEYLSKVSKERKETNIINVIYKFDFMLYIFRPLLACIKLFPMLLSPNQRKEKKK